MCDYDELRICQYILSVEYYVAILHLLKSYCPRRFHPLWVWDWLAHYHLWIRILPHHLRGVFSIIAVLDTSYRATYHDEWGLLTPCRRLGWATSSAWDLRHCHCTPIIRSLYCTEDLCRYTSPSLRILGGETWGHRDCHRGWSYCSKPPLQRRYRRRRRRILVLQYPYRKWTVVVVCDMGLQDDDWRLCLFRSRWEWA